MSDDSELKEESKDDGANGSRRLGIYFLPNLFTTASIFGGFYAIIAAMNHHFSHAAFAIILAMICDSLDGRVARLINAQSLFGAHYDSLSDLVSFGVAPALVLYNWSLIHLARYGFEKIGWLSAFLYVACVALRLAKFNSMSQDTPEAKRYFFGLPCPAPAGLVATLIWFAEDVHASGILFDVGVTLLTIVLALLMVSNIKYRSFKDVKMTDRVRFISTIVIVLVIILIALEPLVLFPIACLYVLSGPIGGVLRWRKSHAKTSVC